MTLTCNRPRPDVSEWTKKLKPKTSKLAIAGLYATVCLFVSVGAFAVGSYKLKQSKLWHGFTVHQTIGPYSTTHPYLPLAKPQKLVEEKGGLVVACLGGSTTYPKIYTDAVQRSLVRLGVAAPAVLNYGAETYNTLDSLVNLVSRGQLDSLDYVVVYHAFNDVTVTVGVTEKDFHQDTSHYRQRADSFAATKEPHPMLNITIKRPTTKMARNGGPFFPDGLEAFRTHLVSLVGVAKAHGIVPCLVTQIHNNEYSLKHYGCDYVAKAVAARNEITREVASEHDVFLFDAEKEVSVLVRHVYDVCHFTQEGYALFGDYIAKKLVQSGLNTGLATVK